jgi:hypothetical protein
MAPFVDISGLRLYEFVGKNLHLFSQFFILSLQVPHFNDLNLSGG